MGVFKFYRHLMGETLEMFVEWFSYVIRLLFMIA